MGFGEEEWVSFMFGGMPKRYTPSQNGQIRKTLEGLVESGGGGKRRHHQSPKIGPEQVSPSFCQLVLQHIGGTLARYTTRVWTVPWTQNKQLKTRHFPHRVFQK